MCAKRIKILMTRLSVCSLGVSCNEMIDTPMLLVVILVQYLLYFTFDTFDSLTGSWSVWPHVVTPQWLIKKFFLPIGMIIDPRLAAQKIFFKF